MKIGLIGLPSVGKTSLFNLLTGSNIEVTDFSQGKVEAHMGIAKIPDDRIDYLTKLYEPKKVTYATIEVIDVPGLVRGASEGKGVGNSFLDNIRKVDVLVHVLRAFENPQVVHDEGTIDPMRDIDTVNLELLFSDLEVVENRIKRLRGEKKVPKEKLQELEVLEKCKEGLEAGQLLHNIDFTGEEREVLKNFSFLSEKPMILVSNVDEDQWSKKDYPSRESLLRHSKDTSTPLIELSIKTEMEIDQLDPEDRQIFLEDLGIKESSLDKLAKTAYNYLGLISFITAGHGEVRAWPIKKNIKAKKAAGKIHSDIERGFIRAEVCKYRHIQEHGSMQKAKEKGLLTLEGKDYIVEDGDIMNFRFNV